MEIKSNLYHYIYILIIKIKYLLFLIKSNYFFVKNQIKNKFGGQNFIFLKFQII